jgi:hypothetical protein
MGVSDCDSMLMLLGVAESMSQEERDVVTRLMIKGFNGSSLCVDCFLEINSHAMLCVDLAQEAGTSVTGGQT